MGRDLLWPRHSEAELLYARALAIREKALGSEHPELATSLENYAALLRQTGRTNEAERMRAWQMTFSTPQPMPL